MVPTHGGEPCHDRIEHGPHIWQDVIEDPFDSFGLWLGTDLECPGR